MIEIDWDEVEEFTGGWGSSRGLPIVGSVKWRRNVARLYFGRRFKETINPGDRFRLFFSRKIPAILLQRHTEGFRVTQTNTMFITRFCRHFGLTKDYVINDYSIEDTAIILPLTEADKHKAAQ